MPLRVSPSIEDVRDLELLIRANHSLIVLETEEPERAEPLVRPEEINAPVSLAAARRRYREAG